MSAQPFVLKPDERKPASNVVGTQVTVSASNEATQSYGITLQQGTEGTGRLTFTFKDGHAFVLDYEDYH